VSYRELLAVSGKTAVGRVLRNNNGRLKFLYEEAWRSSDDAFPLSLSMPLTSAEHSHERIDTFLWGLLPDNAAVLDHWGRQFQVSPRNAFALLSHVGEDCAGAVQFIPPERLDAVLTKRPEPVLWLTEQEVAERLRILRADHSAWRLQGDTGLFSLAGAQPKTALLFEKGRWGVPSGRTPTTHILKPPAGPLAGFIVNEHLCLQLARRLEFPTANSSVMSFDSERAIVLERFDRVRRPAGWLRIHQEDLCQALGVYPSHKYQHDGGPGPKAIVELIRNHSSAPNDDVVTFVDALAFNWLIAGTDAHAKNYALLIAPGAVRLAPLYDVASILPYPRFDVNRVKLAMKIAGRYRMGEIRRGDWLKAAEQLQLSSNALLERITRMAEAICEVTPEIGAELKHAGVTEPVVDRLVTRLVGRGQLCLKRMGVMGKSS
jgi:serine/threonine-protein kinase HipA